MKYPLVSVVMPVYNAHGYLQQALDSILTQSLKNFELIIVDDHSTDDSLEILSSYSDTRIVVIKNGQNRGIGESLNIGLAQAKGKYIARMDADDIVFKDRLQKQVSFLEENPQIDILSGNSYVIDKDNRIVGMTYLPIDHFDILWSSGFFNPFCHPLVIFRRSFLKQHHFRYMTRFENLESAAEDFALWSQMLKHGKSANLNEPLLYYRNHSTNITNSIPDKIHLSTKIIATKNMRELHAEVDSPFDYDNIFDCFHSFHLPKKYHYKDYSKKIEQVLRLFRIFQDQVVDLDNGLNFSRLKLIISILRSKLGVVDKLRVMLDNRRDLLPKKYRISFLAYFFQRMTFYFFNKLRYRYGKVYASDRSFQRRSAS